MPPEPRFRSSCTCGTVLLETSGPPIAAVVCHCRDCRAAAEQIERLPNASPVREPAGGTTFLVFRKDRMVQAQGAGRLHGMKLRPSSPTTRYLAACCNTMMYLGFDDSKHWVSMNRDRFHGDVPAAQMRICTGSGRGETVPSDLPRHRGYPIGFIARLVWAGIVRRAGR